MSMNRVASSRCSAHVPPKREQTDLIHCHLTLKVLLQNQQSATLCTVCTGLSVERQNDWTSTDFPTTHPRTRPDGLSRAPSPRCVVEPKVLNHVQSAVIDRGGVAAASNRYGMIMEPGMVAAELCRITSQGMMRSGFTLCRLSLMLYLLYFFAKTKIQACSNASKVCNFTASSHLPRDREIAKHCDLGYRRNLSNASDLNALHLGFGKSCC